MNFDDFKTGCPRRRLDWYNNEGYRCRKNKYPFDDNMRTNIDGAPQCLEQTCEAFYAIKYLNDIMKGG